MPNKKAAIAVSGGVDSSVAASLLMKDGYEVMGVTMLVCPVSLKNPEGDLYSPDMKEIISMLQSFIHKIDEGIIFLTDIAHHEELSNKHCIPAELFHPPLNALLDAALVCRHLNIPHHILDLREDFDRTIIDYFAGEYYAGRTPNPCVLCNPEIKFGRLMDYSLQLGADFFATGHYARIRKDEKTGLFELLRGIDESKDQAYALFRLTQQQLSHILFPLGELTKETTRRIAEELNLYVKEKPESQEICFIPDDDYTGFLQRRYSMMDKPGDIIHVNGEILGRHKGLIHYTIGQRKRLGIAHPRPLYVLKIDAMNNNLIVGYWEDLFISEASVGDLHFISGSIPDESRIMAKIRYNQNPVPAVLEISGNQPSQTARVKFDEVVRAVTPGQSAVFYSYPSGEKVLGGGMILQV